MEISFAGGILIEKPEKYFTNFGLQLQVEIGVKPDHVSSPGFTIRTGGW